MNNILMYCHNGSGNHGCEAIIRSTVNILNNVDKYQYYVISRNVNQDQKYRIHEQVDLLSEFSPVERKGKEFFIAYMNQKICQNYNKMNDLSIKKPYEIPVGQTVSLSIGGDNYCYDGYKRYIKYHQLSMKNGHKTVLWGCSVEPSFLEKKDLLDDLKTFDKIIVRESISYQAMKKKGLKNVVIYPDPAFALEKSTDLIEKPKNNTVGINISPMVLEYGNKNSKIIENYIELIKFILQNTDMNIALIPHVVWEENDDRRVLKKLKNSFPNEPRISIVEDSDCRQLKAYISGLRFLVGARTHATIAAYSSGVPTLVAGYSVKSRGIAKDIFGTDNNYVVSVKGMNDENELTKAFSWIVDHEKKIKNHLASVMPNYIAKAYDAGKEIQSLFNCSNEKLKTGILKEDCIGCTACVEVCPTESIRFSDDGDGFFYPTFEEKKCINCDKCKSACIINKKIQPIVPMKCYAVKNKDDEVRMNSSSGGVFFALAKKILQEDGIIYGSAFNKKYEVVHIKVDSNEDLNKLQGAKYSQSRLNNIYSDVKNELSNGKKILFTGTPCQVSGLKSFLGKEYDNLLCVDFICHGVPSPKVWEKYIYRRMEKDGESAFPRKINLRSKESGWSRYKYSIKVEYSDGTCFKEKNDENLFLKGFTQDYYLRLSCYRCHFKGVNHQSDITIGDFWGIWNSHPKMDDDKGTSAVIINSERGMDIFNSGSEEFDVLEVSLDEIKDENISWIKSAKYTSNREKFFLCFNNGEDVESIVSKIEEEKIPKRGIIDILPAIKNKIIKR